MLEHPSGMGSRAPPTYNHAPCPSGGATHPSSSSSRWNSRGDLRDPYTTFLKYSPYHCPSGLNRPPCPRHRSVPIRPASSSPGPMPPLRSSAASGGRSGGFVYAYSQCAVPVAVVYSRVVRWGGLRSSGGSARRREVHLRCSAPAGPAGSPRWLVDTGSEPNRCAGALFETNVKGL